MTLYEINEEIQKLISESIDPESGLVDESKISYLDQLNIQRNDKILNIGCLIKDWTAEMEAHKVEESKQRQKKLLLEKKIERMKSWLEMNLEVGKHIKDSRIDISLRKTQQSLKLLVEPNQLPTKYQRKKIEADKIRLKKDLNDQNLKKNEYAELIDNYSVFIK